MKCERDIHYYGEWYEDSRYPKWVVRVCSNCGNTAFKAKSVKQEDD